MMAFFLRPMEWFRIYSIFYNNYISAITHDQPAYANINNSQLHYIATRPPFIPYTDPVKWALDHVIPKERYFDDHAQTQVAYFHPKVFAR